MGSKFDNGAKQPVPRVVAVNRSAGKGVPKQTVAFGELITDYGLKDDAQGKTKYPHREMKKIKFIVFPVRKTESP